MLIRRSFSLDTERDAHLIAWLDSHDNVSEAVRTALRAQCDECRVTLRDVSDSLESLAAKLDEVLAGNEAGATHALFLEEDPQLATNLDQLGL